jgi:tetratricopeptide (TPR) repeat protein
MGDAAAYYNRGLNRTELGDTQGGIDDLTQAIQLKPDRANAYYYRGVARFKLGDKNGAIDDLTQAAKLYEKQGKTKDSQDTLDLLKKINPPS